MNKYFTLQNCIIAHAETKPGVNLKLKIQNERQQVFIWDKRITILGAWIQAESQIVSLLQGESKVFFTEKKKRINYIKRRKKFLLMRIS